ncbi:hypothetical protein LCGC14_2409840, partial [marine sediment metagenome]
ELSLKKAVLIWMDYLIDNKYYSLFPKIKAGKNLTSPKYVVY